MTSPDASCSSSLRHLRGNAEAVLVMTTALLDRYRSMLGEADLEWIAGASSQLSQLIAEGAEDELNRGLEEFDRISARLAEVITGCRRVA